MARQKLGLSGEKIALVGLAELCKIAHVDSFTDDVIVYELKSEDELPDAMRYLKSLGVEVVIGGGRFIALAKNFGMKSAYIEVDDVSLEQAIKEAVHNLKILNELEKKNEMINSILGSVSEGIIAIDHNGRISHMNSYAQKLLGYVNDSWLNEEIENVLPKLECIKDVIQGVNITGELITIRGNYVTVSSKHIHVGQTKENIGAVLTIQGVDQIHKLESNVRKNLLGKGHVARAHFSDILGKSPQIRKMKEMAKEFAVVDSAILILGETGVGKEVFAQSIHNYSSRQNKPFIAVNCAAFPPHLLESELFGYVKGAFTGASPQGKMGVFELAHTGTIFLDEIGEMPIALQAKLLRVLQEKEVTRLGDDKVVPVDVRILSATNKNILKQIQRGGFREDLYYRLCVLSLTIPALRERKEDIPDLALYFIKQCNKLFSRNIQALTPEARDMLMAMDWPGNIRQLRNFIERAVVLCKGKLIDAEIIRSAQGCEGGEELKEPIYQSEPSQDVGLISKIEKDLIRKLLIETNGDKQEVAKRLGISTTTLWRRMKKFSLEETNQNKA